MAVCGRWLWRLVRPFTFKHSIAKVIWVLLQSRDHIRHSHLLKHTAVRTHYQLTLVTKRWIYQRRIELPERRGHRALHTHDPNNRTGISHHVHDVLIRARIRHIPVEQIKVVRYTGV